MKPAGAPFDNIQEHSLEILKTLSEPAPDRLYHYTSADGLRGILESGRLRGSNYAFMNDRSEFTYGAELLRKVVSERARAPKGETDQDYYEAILRSERPIVSDLYLVCFCTEGDLLSQWRGYGSQGSRYCLRFDPNDFVAVHGASPLLPVVYDEQRQRRILGDLLDAHLTGLNGHTGYDPAFYDSAASCTYACCITAFGLFKNEAFYEEQEWRSVLLVRPGNLVTELEFWSSGGVMKPSLELLAGPHGKLPVREIICGASAVPTQAVRSAKLMLARYGYDDLPVNPSDIPLSG